MKKLHAVPATPENFAPFGEVVYIYVCDEPDSAMCYFPDQMILDLHGEQAIAGVCHVAPQQAVIPQAEYHVHTDEGWILMNGEAVSAFALPCEDPNKAEFLAFSFPEGAYVRIKKGVWHFAPLPTGQVRLAAYCTLPPKTPENDCIVADLDTPIVIEA